MLPLQFCADCSCPIADTIHRDRCDACAELYRLRHGGIYHWQLQAAERARRRFIRAGIDAKVLPNDFTRGGGYIVRA